MEGFIRLIYLALAIKGAFPACTWGSWSACNPSCGGERLRFRYCYWSWWNHRSIQYKTCDPICIHGSILNEACVCPMGYSGTCCEVAPICQLPCRNGGTCIGDDMCKCPDGFYGLQCEIASQAILENLKPQFNPVLDPNEIYKDKSWYDEPLESGFNRVCFIKVATENAPNDAYVTAISSRYVTSDNLIQYGNFSTGPVDANATLNGKVRFACLQVRCPGWTLDGTSFNVNVDVMIQSRNGQCNITSSNSEIPEMSVSINKMAFTLTEGNNYGPDFGIYFKSGQRQQAEYLSKQVCYSGRQYYFTGLHNARGIVATFSC